MLESKAWPFQEAKALLHRLGGKLPNKGFVLFETGYGPSGLPHIGTFGEVIRTTMVRNAFEKLSGMPTKLWCISDDMDGMRKIPDTIPNAADYRKYLDLPLTAIPDPFGTHESFGHHMNARLRAFLDSFGFEYEFKSATECYKSGVFNDMLLRVLANYDKIMDIMLPTLGEERQQTYSPFLPLSQSTGKVLQVPIIDRNLADGMISYIDPDTKDIVHTKVTDGFCKLQWKPDFGMRWAAFDVDFEMYGKDHLVNGKIYSAICKVIGGAPPHQMFYELFLDENGQKISKSKGNGLTIDSWLRYAPRESLSLFMYVNPQKAKKLYFDIIPKCVDEYLAHLKNYHAETDLSKKIANPVFHVHNGNPPIIATSISYALLLNLVSTCNTDNEKVIWGYIDRFDNKSTQDSPTQDGRDPNHHGLLSSGKDTRLNKAIGLDTDEMDKPSSQSTEYMKLMVRGAMNYYHDFIKPYKLYREPRPDERVAIHEVKLVLEGLTLEEMESGAIGDLIQNKIYEIGKKYDMELKTWFAALYEILLGANSGPRFGSFVALYGVDKTIKMIDDALDGGAGVTKL